MSLDDYTTGVLTFTLDLAANSKGGIITPSRHPLVIIISGEDGQTHGYADRTRPRWRL